MDMATNPIQFDFSKMEYFATSEKLVNILMTKTQNNNPLFFRILVAYYLTKVASMMRCNIITHDRGIIPVNMYAINLATSGQGKGHSTNIIEENVINKFRLKFLNETFPVLSDENLEKLAKKKANRKNTDDIDEKLRLEKEFNDLGSLAFSFDSATTPAVKQMRQKLLLANAGSMNMEIDEIGSNLTGTLDVLTTFLELFDVGKVKQKLIKNTAESKRLEDIEGRTPTNMMLFGTPSKLLDGDKTEETLMSILDAGLARRCFFGYIKSIDRNHSLTEYELYDMMTDTTNETYLEYLSQKIEALANINNFKTHLTMTKDVSLELIRYKIYCDRLAVELPEHDEMRKAEITHRYFKACKLAGTYAFIDGSPEITEEYLHNAIKLVEDSGESFHAILCRDRNYVKLANYIASIKRPVTHVDLVEDLPFYKGTENQKRDLLTLAIAYGYPRNIVIKRSLIDGIEFLSGETLEETDLKKMIISHSSDLAKNYIPEYAPFDDLYRLTVLPDHNFTTHHLKENYRNEANCIPGFNMVVLDIDGGLSIDTARLLLQEYKYHIYETKRSTPEHNRFRVILPLSHKLELTADEFKEFMNNIYSFLPFDVDEQTNQRSRKWATYPSKHFTNDGKLLDALLFIPRTKKSEERQIITQTYQSLNNLERWFVSNTTKGNRSNQLIKYAFMLIDAGVSITDIRDKVLDLNHKLPDKLPDAEITNTIMVSVAKKIQNKDTTA
jgi:hypothetical protein